VSDKVNPYSFNNDTYGSYSRDEAMIMDTYLLLGQTDKAFTLSQSISQALSNDYISTQTAAFGLMSMSKLAKKMGKGNIDAQWTLNGKKMSNINTPQAFWQTSLNPLSVLNVSVSNFGKSKIYARLTARTQPLDEIPLATTASFKLIVTYTDKNGNSLDIKSLKQGTEFSANVVVQNDPALSFTDLALVEIFPSGWEIYNERLMNADGNNAANYTYRDIRDDRVLTYFNLGAGQTKSFRVRLQAAYKGTYYLPSVSCQAMYEPREQAKTSGMWVVVN